MNTNESVNRFTLLRCVSNADIGSTPIFLQVIRQGHLCRLSVVRRPPLLGLATTAIAPLLLALAMVWLAGLTRADAVRSVASNILIIASLVSIALGAWYVHAFASKRPRDVLVYDLQSGSLLAHPQADSNPKRLEKPVSVAIVQGYYYISQHHHLARSLVQIQLHSVDAPPVLLVQPFHDQGKSARSVRAFCEMAGCDLHQSAATGQRPVYLSDLVAG